MALSKQSILKHAGVFTPRVVHVPEWADENGDDVVLVRGMTIREFELNQGRAENGEATASVIARCVLDETGGRLFDDSDVRMIAELPLARIGALSKAITEESGLGDNDAEQAVKDAEGNSAATPSDGSSSD